MCEDEEESNRQRNFLKFMKEMTIFNGVNNNLGNLGWDN